MVLILSLYSLLQGPLDSTCNSKTVTQESSQRPWLAPGFKPQFPSDQPGVSCCSQRTERVAGRGEEETQQRCLGAPGWYQPVLSISLSFFFSEHQPVHLVSSPSLLYSSCLTSLLQPSLPGLGLPTDRSRTSFFLVFPTVLIPSQASTELAL